MNCNINLDESIGVIKGTIQICISSVNDIKQSYLDIRDRNEQDEILKNITTENVTKLFGLIKIMIEEVPQNKNGGADVRKKGQKLSVSTNNYYLEIIECLFSNMIDYYIHVLESVLKPSNGKINPETFVEKTMDCLNFKKSIRNIKCLIQKIVESDSNLYMSQHYVNNSNKYVPDMKISALFGVGEYIRAGILVLVVFVIGIECTIVNWDVNKNRKGNVKEEQVKDFTGNYRNKDDAKHQRFNILFGDNGDLLSENICATTDTNVLYRALVKNIQELIRVSKYDVNVLKHNDYLRDDKFANEKITTNNKCGSDYNNIYNFMKVIGSNRNSYYRYVLHLFNKDIDIDIEIKN